jgi:membrane protease YdiL (CAAX protease family)
MTQTPSTVTGGRRGSPLPPVGRGSPPPSSGRGSPSPSGVGAPSGRVAHERGSGARLSTAPTPASATASATAPGVTAKGRLASVVIAVGILFLLARPTLGALPVAVPVLALGYLAVLVAALAAPRSGQTGPAPLGWRVPLLLGLAGVAGAAVVAGPVADRRVGSVAVGLALGAAVAEEALFRRVLYERLLRFGVVAAVAGSAALFALVHLPAYGVAAMPVDLGAGLLLSWQRYASGHWTVPAVTHVVANLLAVT